MNDPTSNNNHNIENQIKGQLVLKAKKMLDTINAGTIPRESECLELQDIYREYLSVVIYKQGKASDHNHGNGNDKDIIQILFTDTTSENVESNDVIADLLAEPSIISLLYVIALRKIVKEKDLVITAYNKKWLLEHGYVSKLTIKDVGVSDQYYSLTSKGWLCFSRTNIVHQVRKNLGYTTLFIPDWLVNPQLKWKPATYHRAILLRKYYKKNTYSNDYLIFSFPENEQLLFGCYADSRKEVDYTCAIPEKAPLTEEEKHTLLKVIASDTVHLVNLLVTDLSLGGKIIESLDPKGSVSNKTSVYLVGDI